MCMTAESPLRCGLVAHLWLHNSVTAEENLLYITLKPPALMASGQLDIQLQVTSTERAHLRT